MFDYFRALTKRAEAQHEYNRLMSREQQAFIDGPAAIVDRAERDELNQLRAEKKAMLEHKAEVFDRQGGLRGIPRRDRTDLPTLRAYDLAGYLGRVNELLLSAAYATMPFETDPEQTKKAALSQHFLRAASVAASIQGDLIALHAELESAAFIDTALEAAMTGRPKWTDDELKRAAAEKQPEATINHIKDMEIEPAITLEEAKRWADAMRWAEGLIEQLPPGHAGADSWLLNYGWKRRARGRRKNWLTLNTGRAHLMSGSDKLRELLERFAPRRPDIDEGGPSAETLFAMRQPCPICDDGDGIKGGACPECGREPLSS
jgi:hypothetical protein